VNPRGGYPPIEDYGLIGDCRAAALISGQGSLDWLCLPRFDSPSIFARILDLKRGGAWSIHPAAPFRAEHRYLKDTNVLETAFSSDRGRVRLLDFMPVSSEIASGKAHPLHAVVRIVEGVTGEIEIESICAPRPDYARTVPTLAARGGRVEFDRFSLSGPARWRVDEAGGTTSCRMTVRAGERVALTFQYRGHDHPSAPVDDPFASFRETVAFWRGWVERCACHSALQ
jgi:GH15 family glucan-1,4-alpha-glucosidase